jgi:hypothetical protein
VSWNVQLNGGGGPPLSLFVSAYCIGIYAVAKILIGPSFGLIGPPNWPPKYPTCGWARCWMDSWEYTLFGVSNRAV